jgi:hypothetical protein
MSFTEICFSQNYDAELMSQVTKINISNTKLHKELYYEIKINNRAGDEYARISIPYSKLDKISNINAFIKNSDGEIIKRLRKGDIITRSLFADFLFYEDKFVKEFTLKHNSYPYTIVYTYQIQHNEFVYIDYWQPFIDVTIPTHNSELNISTPINYSLKYRNQHIEDCGVDTIESRINYQWKASYTNLIEYEINAPPVSELMPSVTIVPVDFKFESNGSLRDWISYGNWEFELLQGLNELPDTEKNRIDLLVKNISDDKEKVKLLYHSLQDETRYVNITIETGGLKPYPASYVAHNKYGDCKALTNYFKAILDYLKIPSYYTNVYAGNPNRKIDINFPSQQFNHVILYIPQKDGDIWLDCTSDAAFNYLGTFSQNRDAFIIAHNNSRFLKTPTLSPYDVLNSRKIVVNYNDIESLVEFKNVYRGEFYEQILSSIKNFNEKKRDAIVRNYFIPDRFQLIDYHLFKPIRDTISIKLDYNATSQSLYKHYGKDIHVSNIAFSLPNYENPKIRKLPLQLDYPICNIDSIIYEIPNGYKFHTSQNDYSVISKFGEYKLNIKELDGLIHVEKSLLINSGYYLIEEYEEFYNFYKQIIELENKTHISFYK